jgi:hypothetical protein
MAAADHVLTTLGKQNLVMSVRLASMPAQEWLWYLSNPEQHASRHHTPNKTVQVFVAWASRSPSMWGPEGGD